MAGLKHYESSFAPRAIVNSASGCGLITLEVCIITAFPHFDLSNFPVLNYKKTLGIKTLCTTQWIPSSGRLVVKNEVVEWRPGVHGAACMTSCF